MPVLGKPHDWQLRFYLRHCAESAAAAGFHCVPQAESFSVEQWPALNQKAISNPTHGLIAESNSLEFLEKL